MSLYAIKPQFQSLLRPTVQRIHLLGINANQVTLAACAVSLALGAFLALVAETPTWFVLLPAWLALRMACNAIDGMLAREFGQATPLGAYLNELTDIISDAALYLPFALIAGVSSAWVGLVVLMAVLAEFAGVLGGLVGASRRHDGPLGKSDRAFVFGVLGLTLGLGLEPGEWVNIVLAAVAMLTMLTAVNRVRQGLAEASTR